MEEGKPEKGRILDGKEKFLKGKRKKDQTLEQARKLMDTGQPYSEEEKLNMYLKTEATEIQNYMSAHRLMDIYFHKHGYTTFESIPSGIIEDSTRRWEGLKDKKSLLEAAMSSSTDDWREDTLTFFILSIRLQEASEKSDSIEPDPVA